MALLSALAGQLAMVTQNADMFQRLESSYFSTVTALASAIEAKDEYTADHCRLIAGMAEIVGGQMGLERRGPAPAALRGHPARHRQDRRAGIRAAVAGAASADEQFALVADHTVMGESIVARINYLSPIAPVIRSAHERWDGNGYPDRLRGEEIPLAARIVFACDSCHAMVSDRPYRKALTHEAAFAELVDNSGSPVRPAGGRGVRRLARRDRAPLHDRRPAAQQVDRVLATVLFTDIVGSTVKAAEMGDSAWRELLDRHHATVRAVSGAIAAARSTPPATASSRRSTGRRGPWSVRLPSVASWRRSASRSGPAATPARSS